jgi:gliding motility-associated-like protein
MISTNQSGQACTYVHPNIIVSDTPHFLNPQIGPNAFCAPQTVTLNMGNNPGCGNITQTQIQWGCGNITTVAGPITSASHLYNANCNPQCYNVNIVAINSCGCVGTQKLTGSVCVLPKPVANFTVDVSSGVCVNSLTSNFVAFNNGSGFTYTWFANGTQLQSSSSINFTHTFPAAFNCYQIKLIVSNSVGCADTLVRDNFICVFAAPHLAFTQDTTSLCVDPGQTGLLCLHDASLPFLPSPVWRVRGGNPLVNLGPYTGDTVCVPITNPGSYQVTLIGSYGIGCTDSIVVPNAFTLKQNPIPCFFADDSFSCNTQLCTGFHNCSTAPPGSTYLWNFGAGAIPLSSSLQNPTPPQVCYNGLGKRDVSLAVTSTNGCFKLLKKTNYIVVDTVTPFMLLGNPFGCGPLQVGLQSITNVPPGSPYYISDYLWSLYPHGSSSLVHQQHGSAIFYSFNTPGCYDVNLKITTNTLCHSSTWDTAVICVGVPPVCTMTVSPDTMCFEADSVVFNVGGPNCNCNRYIVHFGDEVDPNDVTYINSSPFVHIYQSFGDFDAWVIPIQDSCESDSILTAHIVVYPPAASFTSSTNCLSGDTVCFINGSLGANRYHWNFSCAPDTFNTFAPCLILPHCDSCIVTLTAYNDTTHCIHHKTQSIQTACAGVNATFDPDTLIGCNGFATTAFTNTTPGAGAGQTVWHFNTIGGGLIATGVVAYKNWYPGIWHPYMVYTAPGGCIDTAFGLVQSCALHTDFLPSSVCLPDSFHFRPLPFDTVALGVGCDSIIDWRWNFGGGDTTHEQFPVRGFSLGNHSVQLKVTNIYGCTATITKIVTTGTPVYSYWSVDTNICPGSTVAITNATSSGVSLTETWETPGGNYTSFAGPNPPSITYYTDGDFPFIYTVSGGTCHKSDTVTMHVHAPILSGYLTDDFASCPPLAVCAINTSQWVDSLTDIYTWDFGNFEYLEVNPCDFYIIPGVFEVQLSVLTDNGCRDTITIDTVVVDGPYGSISHSPRGICSCKDSVDYVISSVKATELTFVYGCNVGFNIVSPITPIGTDINPHVFNYRIPYCLTDSCLPQVTFGDATGCHVLFNDSLVYIDSPVINIAFNNYGICLAGTVNFFDATTYTLPSNISYSTQWSWDFGDPFDQTASNDTNPSHYYSQPGVYPVTFRVTSNFGCYDSIISTSVVIIPKFPIAGFYGDDSLICAETSTCFHDTSYIDPNTGPQFWYWDFGDGSTDSTSGANPCHTYQTGGYFTVHLCIYDSIGCADCDSGFVIRVISKPIANAGPDTVFCYGVQVQLSGSGSNSCQWSPPGLVSNANICNPTTLIFQDTCFILTVTDTFGCFGKDTMCARVAYVTADFNVSATSCLEDSFCVTDISTNINGILTSWVYNFGDGDSLAGADVCHKYSVPGSYDIFETVTDNHGCTDTTERPVIIFPQPMAAFSLNDSIVCSDQPVCFTDLSTSITAIQSWNWNFGFNQGNFSGANPPCHIFTPPYQSTYTISLAVTDQNQCNDTALIIVTVNQIPQANFSWVTSCEDTNMPLSSTSINGDGAIDSCIWLLWIGAPSPVTDYNCNTSFLFPPGTHDVQLVVHDLNGCADTIVKTVLTDSLSQLVIYPGDTTICLGTSVDYTVSGVFDNITWSPNVWISDAHSPVVTVTPLGNVGYIVSAVNGVCNSDNDTFSVQVIQPIPIEVNATPQQIVLGLSSNIASQIPAPIDSIVWSPDSTLDCTNCFNPVATPKQTTTYCATIYYGKNGITCTNLACVTIDVFTVCGDSMVYVPNTFTPNGDGINDIFMIRSLAATKINYFRIFDRWGKLIFEALNGAPNETRWGWDGTDKASEKLNPAVFVYTLQVECINHDIITRSGNITLVR